MDITNRLSFQSTQFQLESANFPKIKAGGSSSSDLINRWIAALSRDVTLMNTRLNALSTKCSNLEDIIRLQGSYFSGLYNQLNGQVAVASGYSQILADMHSLYYVDQANSTAFIDNQFGQVTLPVNSQVNLLVQTDVYGNKTLISNLDLSYCVNNSASTPPSDGDFVSDPNALYMLREDQYWPINSNPGDSQVFVKLNAPLQFRGLTPNMIEIWPLSIGACTLNNVWYQAAGSTGSWTALDLSYLSGFSSTTTSVLKFAPVRLHLPNLPISQICFSMDLNSATTWGLYKFRVYHNEYASTASLAVQDPYNRTLGDSILRGKDPAILSNLSLTNNGNEVTITLATTDSTYTPCISGVILNVN